MKGGHITGPFDQKPIANLHCSPLGSDWKPDGTLRLICGLSSPRGFSVNDNIDKDDIPVRYSSFDDAVDRVASLGTHSFLAKFDIKNAFTICPVRKDD